MESGPDSGTDSSSVRVVSTAEAHVGLDHVALELNATLQWFLRMDGFLFIVFYIFKYFMTFGVASLCFKSYFSFEEQSELV